MHPTSPHSYAGAVARPRLLGRAELARRLLVREWVVDVRPRTSFAVSHVPGSLNFGLGEVFATYLNRFYDWGAPLTLIAETREQHAEARRRLNRVGINRFTGAAIGRPETLMDGGHPASYPIADFAALSRAMAVGTPTVLDVRPHEARAEGSVRDSLHSLVQTLGLRCPVGAGTEIWVYSGTGYSASIAASMLARAGCHPVLVDGRYDDPVSGASAVGLHTSPPGGTGDRGSRPADV